MNASASPMKSSVVVAPIVAIPMLLVLLILLLLPGQPRKRHGGDADEED